MVAGVRTRQLSHTWRKAFVIGPRIARPYGRHRHVSERLPIPRFVVPFRAAVNNVHKLLQSAVPRRRLVTSAISKRA